MISGWVCFHGGRPVRPLFNYETDRFEHTGTRKPHWTVTTALSLLALRGPVEKRAISLEESGSRTSGSFDTPLTTLSPAFRKKHWTPPFGG